MYQMSIVIAMKNQAKFATKKSSQNLKKFRKSKYQGTARFSVRTTSFIDVWYCYLNEFAVFINKTASGFSSNMSIKYMYETSSFL